MDEDDEIDDEFDEEEEYDYREDPDYLNAVDEETGRNTLGVPGFSKLS